MFDTAERIDFIIQKGAKFYQEFQLTEDDGVTPISLVGKKVVCTIKQSFNANNWVHQLTEANEGTTRLDPANGVFCISIPATETNKNMSTAVHNIKLIDDEYPTIETERIIEGKVTYTSDV